jgi:hypothetical protein
MRPNEEAIDWRDVVCKPESGISRSSGLADRVNRSRFREIVGANQGAKREKHELSARNVHVVRRG